MISKINWDKMDNIIPKFAWPEKERKRVVQEKKQEYVKKQYSKQQTLLCENVAEIKPINVVPFKRKIYLTYKDLKAMVCKPIAR